MISQDTREVMRVVVQVMFSAKPGWRETIRELDRQGVTYTEWRSRYFPESSMKALAGVFQRAAERGETSEEVIRAMYDETRRQAGVVKS